MAWTPLRVRTGVGHPPAPSSSDELDEPSARRPRPRLGLVRDELPETQRLCTSANRGSAAAAQELSAVPPVPGTDHGLVGQPSATSSARASTRRARPHGRHQRGHTPRRSTTPRTGPAERNQAPHRQPRRQAPAVAAAPDSEQWLKLCRLVAILARFERISTLARPSSIPSGAADDTRRQSRRTRRCTDQRVNHARA